MKRDYLLGLFQEVIVPVLEEEEEAAEEHPALFKIHLYNSDIKELKFRNSNTYLFLSIPQPVNLVEENRKSVLSLLRFNDKYENVALSYFNHLRQKFL